ncbi:TPA: VPA0450 family T3SS effector inositol phosphatase, partial [Vibrio parahaemolyticus]|nr:VPA0450 family T3SS effector inositol phosphatase [Vibrio parahaemolyticus]
MSTIQINSQHRGNLDLADIQNIKTNAKEGDTVKFGSVFGKEYSVTKSNDGEISLKQKENRSFFNRFFSKTDSSKNSDLKLNLMNQQLHKKENNGNVKVLTLTYNQANQKMPAETKNYFQNLIQKGDYDVVLFAEQESKLLANDLELDGMNLLSQNKMKVMTKGLGEGISYTSMSVFAKDGVDINVKKESEYRHGIGGRNMEFFMGITGNKGGVKTALEINGQPLNVISAHLDSNKEVKREFEGNKLMEGINPNEEVLITGDLNEREKRVAEGSDALYDPIAHDDTHLAKHGFKFKTLDSHTYMQLDKHTGNIKQKEGRDRPDFGELDNTGLTNKTGNLQ